MKQPTVLELWRGASRGGAVRGRNRLRTFLGGLAIAVAVATIAIVVRGTRRLRALRPPDLRARVRQRHVRARARDVRQTSVGANWPSSWPAIPPIRAQRRPVPGPLRGGPVVYAPLAQRCGGRDRRRAEVRERVGQRHGGGAVRHPRPRHRARPVPPPRRRGPRRAGGRDRRRRRGRLFPASIRSAGVRDRGARVRGDRRAGAQGSAGGVSLDRYVWMPLQAFERVFGAPDSLQVFARAPSAGPAPDAPRTGRASTMRARRQLRPGVGDTFDILTPEAARSFVAAAVGADRRGRRADLDHGPAGGHRRRDQHDARVGDAADAGDRRAARAGRGPAPHHHRGAGRVQPDCASSAGAVGLAGGAGCSLALAAGPLDLDLPLRPSTDRVEPRRRGLSGIVAGWYPARRAARIDVDRRHPAGVSRREDDARVADTGAAALRESASLAVDSVRTQPARSFLAIAGIVIGIVTVVLVASVLANLRNQVALLFRELGTDNVFAFHLTGDPYQPPSEAGGAAEAAQGRFAATSRATAGRSATSASRSIVPHDRRRAGADRAGRRPANRTPSWSKARRRTSSRWSGPNSRRGGRSPRSRTGGARRWPSSARAWRARCSDRSAPSGSRSRSRATPTSWSARWRRARAGSSARTGRTASCRSRVGTAKRRFAEADKVVLYARARPGLRDQAKLEVEASLRRLRRLAPAAENDFTCRRRIRSSGRSTASARRSAS